MLQVIRLVGFVLYDDVDADDMRYSIQFNSIHSTYTHTLALFSIVDI